MRSKAIDARKKLNITQEEFARLLGVSWRTVARWECGDSFINKTNIEKIEAILRDQ
jgi:DNA-binding transcriptional regulator YiaG